MKPHIKRVWCEPSCCFVWQMDIQRASGEVWTLLRLELDEFVPTSNPDMARIYMDAAAVRVN